MRFVGGTVSCTEIEASELAVVLFVWGELHIERVTSAAPNMLAPTTTPIASPFIAVAANAEP
jgi:hypothetical protein